MSIVSHQLSRQLRPTLLVLAACFLLTPQIVRPRAARAQTRVGVPQEKPRVSPTPQPSPSTTPQRKSSKLKKIGQKILGFLACQADKRKKEQELSRWGMQFPAVYNESDFSIVALVKGGWAVVIEYESEQRNTASVTFTVKDVAPFTQPLPVKDAGPNQPSAQDARVANTMVFRLPERFGTTPQAALISFRALTDGPTGKVPGSFQLNAMGIGDRALESASITQPGRQTVERGALQVKIAARGFQPLDNFGSWRAGTPKGVAIVDINITPTPDRVSSRRGGAFDYYFVSTNFFDVWRAEYRRNTKTPAANGGYIYGTEYVGGRNFNEPVSAGPNPQPPPPRKAKRWSIRGGGRFSPGQYKIMVCAWYKVDDFKRGGEAAAKISGSANIY